MKPYRTSPTAFVRKYSGASRGYTKPRVQQKPKRAPQTRYTPKRGRVHQTRSRDIRRRRGRIPATRIKRKDVGADIQTGHLIYPGRGHNNSSKTAQVSIPQSPAIVPLKIVNTKHTKKKKTRKRNKAPLGTKKRAQKKGGLSVR